MSQIFISYSRTDEGFVRQLVKRLEDLGANVWIDVADIRSGQDWSDAIQQALDGSDAMILVISPESMESANVANEWKYHLDDNKPVLPVLWKPARVHFQLRRIQYVNFNNQDFETAFLQLHSELRRKGIALAPVDIEDSSVQLPVQAPLPGYDERNPEPPIYSPPDPTPNYGAGSGGYMPPPPAYGGQYAQPQQGYYGAQASAYPVFSGDLLDYAVNLFRGRNWIVKGFTGDTAWFEGWSFGNKSKKTSMYILMVAAPFFFSLLGGIIAGFIASQSYKRYSVQLKRDAEGRVMIHGDAGQFLVSRPEEMMSVASYIDVDKNSMSGAIVWVLPLVVGLVMSCVWYSILFSGGSSTY